MNSNDLIKRIDGWQYDVPADMKLHALLMDCKAALETKGEPVADKFTCDYCGSNYTSEKYCCPARRKYLNAHGSYEPITTPPSVDALIAEIDGLERIDFDEGGCDYPCSDGDNYRFDDVRAVINKYRSNKP